jgi:AraC-like DNA-binding protein
MAKPGGSASVWLQEQTWSRPDMMLNPVETSLEDLGPLALRLLAEMDSTLDRDAAARRSLSQLQALLRALPAWPDPVDARRSDPSPALSATRGVLAPWQLRRVSEFVDANLDQRLLVEDLASRIRLSASHFCRAFKATTGETPHAYVMRRRLERAQTLILQTSDSLCQIADACGLSDQAHLTRLFRRHLGTTPFQWRRQGRAMAGA